MQHFCDANNFPARQVPGISKEMMIMMLQKRFTPEALESQTALELPPRQMLALVVIRNVLNGLHVRLTVANNRTAVQVCAAVNLINGIIKPSQLTCKISQ
jgi:hypothetical protein